MPPIGNLQLDIKDDNKGGFRQKVLKIKTRFDSNSVAFANKTDKTN